MKYPRDCIDQLLQELQKNDPEDEPGSKSADHNKAVRQRGYPHPERAQLEQILDVAHAASLQPEEGHLPKFAIAFVSPSGLEQKKFVACPFKEPKSLEPHVVAKLAPALASSRTFLGVSPIPAEDGRLRIWGLIHSHRGPMSTEIEDGRPAFFAKGPFLMVRVISPGVIFVYHCHRLHLLYARGETHWGISPAGLQAILREGASMDGDAAEELCHVVESMVLLGKGGTVVVTDPVMEVEHELLDLSYRFEKPNNVLRDSLREMKEEDCDQKTVPPLRAAVDFVAQLSAVDGVVHMTSDLAVVGFGGKVMALQPPDGARFISEAPNSTTEVEAGATRPLELGEIPGMRHRSAALFCARQQGQALAIVVSQDGDVTLFGRQNDGVVRHKGPYALGVGLAVL